MKAHKGFSLIEFLIASAIAAFLSSFLFLIVRQTSRTSLSIDEITDIQFKAILLQRQLERDIGGAFIPFTMLEQEQEKKEPDKKQSPSVPQQRQPAVAEKEQKKAPKIEKIFYAKNNEGQLSLLTCITNNPLTTAALLTDASPVPSLVRVVYRLKEVKHEKSQRRVYTLTWQESENLSFDDYSGKGTIREYELVTEILEFSATFIVLKIKEGANKEKEIEIVKSADWDHEKKEAKNEKQEKEKERPVPHAVQIKMVIGSHNIQRTETFNFIIPILPDFIMKVPHTEEKQGQQSIKPSQQPGAALQARPTQQGNLNNNLGTLPGAQQKPQTMLLSTLPR